MLGSAFIFCAGVVLQVAPSHSIDLFYAGRSIAGLGLGGIFTMAPMYSSEVAPKELRGSLGSCLQWMYTWGVFTSYWIVYAVKKGVSDNTSAQWQIPIGVQMIPAAVLGFGLFSQPESVRWLAKRGKEKEAWEALRWLRADESGVVRQEFNEILVGIQEEQRVKEGLKLRELWRPANRVRLLIAFNIFMAQQFCGGTAMAYFSPQFFEIIVGSGDRDLLITGLFGVIKVIASGIFVIFLAERFERKHVFIAGALGQSYCMIITAVLDKLKPPENDVVSSANIATVAMIFLNIAIFNLSWGPLPYPYMSEIFPSRIREIGVSVGMTSQWLFNCMFSFVTPYMLASMGWGTFLFFAGADVVMALWVFFCLKETRGRSIEEMETIFESAAAFDVDVARDKGIRDEIEFAEVTVGRIGQRQSQA